MRKVNGITFTANIKMIFLKTHHHCSSSCSLRKSCRKSFILHFMLFRAKSIYFIFQQSSVLEFPSLISNQRSRLKRYNFSFIASSVGPPFHVSNGCFPAFCKLRTTLKSGKAHVVDLLRSNDGNKSLLSLSFCGTDPFFQLGTPWHTCDRQAVLLYCLETLTLNLHSVAPRD